MKKLLLSLLLLPSLGFGQLIISGGSSSGGDAVTTNPLSQFASTTSLQLKGVLSDETGSGALVFATSPTFVTPILGTPTSVTLTNGTGLPASGIGSGTLAQARLGTGSDGSGTHFLADDQTYKSPTGSGNALTSDPLSQFASTTSLQLKTVLSDETGSGLAVFATSPTLTTPILGTPTSGNLANCTALPITGLTSSTATALGLGSIELGHASDTTIARASAGEITVEGSPVLLSGGALGTPASGTLTNATGLPIAGLTSSTSTALGVGSVELGAAADTTLSRASAGVLAVEGTNVLLNGGALGTPSSGTLTNATGLPVAGITASTSTALGVGSVELGAASDTTIARSGAGAVTVEGTQVLLSGAALGTPASGTLTNATGLPVAGITSSTSTALGVGSLEVGAASDTTLTRASAGVLAVEGSNLLRAADLGSGMATFLGTPTSANLYATLNDRSGSGGNAVFATAPTLTGLSLANGSTTVAPVTLGTGGSLLTTAAAGAIEADGNTFYGTTDAGNRGIISPHYVIRADSTVTQANDANAHAIFTTPTNGRLTAGTGVYRFKGLLVWSSMSATSGNVKIDILGAGTASVSAWLWFTNGNDGLIQSSGANSGQWNTTSITSANSVVANSNTTVVVSVEGTFEVTGAGTIIPTQTLATAAAGVLSVGSYIEFWRMGSTSMTSVGAWD